MNLNFICCFFVLLFIKIRVAYCKNIVDDGVKTQVADCFEEPTLERKSSIGVEVVINCFDYSSEGNSSKCLCNDGVSMTTFSYKLIYAASPETDTGVCHVNLTVADTKKVVCVAESYRDYRFCLSVFEDTFCYDEFKTDPSEPGPIDPNNVDVFDRTTSNLSLVWNPPLEPNGPIDGYTVMRCHEEGPCRLTPGCNLNVSDSTKSAVYTVANMQAYTAVWFRIAAYNNLGNQTLNGQSIDLCFETHPGKPSHVQDFKIASKNQTSVFLTWQKPAIPNGPIDGYQIIFGSSWNNIGSETSYTILGLEPRQELDLHIFAFNNVPQHGWLFSEGSELKGTTTDCNPTVPRDVAINSVTATSFNVTWKVPERTNGYSPNAVDYYRVIVSGGGSVLEQNTTELNHLFNNLDSGTIYDVSVEAFNKFAVLCISPPGRQSVQTEKNKAGQIVGLVFGVATLVTVSGFVGYKVYRRR